MDREQYTALDLRLQRLEREAAALRNDFRLASGQKQQPAAPVVASPAPQPALAVTAEVPQGAPAVATIRGATLEGFFAGRGLQIAGLFLVLLGTAFFLNLAFTKGWIGPAERIMLGLLAGVALVSDGMRRHRPGYVPIAEGMIALGSGILYLSLWAAIAIFPDLHVPRAAAFVAMVAVTTVLAVVAAARGSERIALMGLVGGFLTPVLLNSGVPQPALLATYVFLLALGFASLGIRARFRIVEAAAFVATMLYLQAFVPSGHTWSVAAACVAATALCALFAIAFGAGAKRDPSMLNMRIALLTLDAFAYAAMLTVIFYFQPPGNHGDTELGIAFLIVAAALLLAARFVRVPAPMTIAYGYLGLAAATLALPALLHRMTLLDAFVLEGAVLVVLGTRRADGYLAAAGSIILGFSSLSLLVVALDNPPANSLFSSISLAFALAVAALVYVRIQVARFALEPATSQLLSALASVAANVVAIAGISRVLLDGFGGPLWQHDVPSHVQFAISVAWTVYATALFAFGMRRNSSLLRWQGLVLFAATIFKVFTVDLSNVDVTWRIASFIVLGVVCMGVSAWYMRVQTRAQESET